MAQAQSRAAGEKVALITGASGGIGLVAGRLRLMRRFVPEKTFEKSFRKQMGVAD
jgi:hypothetical protein